MNWIVDMESRSILFPLYSSTSKSSTTKSTCTFSHAIQLQYLHRKCKLVMHSRIPSNFFYHRLRYDRHFMRCKFVEFNQEKCFSSICLWMNKKMLFCCDSIINIISTSTPHRQLSSLPPIIHKWAESKTHFCVYHENESENNN